jgi:hypothetical protein
MTPEMELWLRFLHNIFLIIMFGGIFIIGLVLKLIILLLLIGIGLIPIVLAAAVIFGPKLPETPKPEPRQPKRFRPNPELESYLSLQEHEVELDYYCPKSLGGEIRN